MSQPRLGFERWRHYLYCHNPVGLEPTSWPSEQGTLVSVLKHDTRG